MAQATDTVLVVDDDPAVRMIVAALLSQEGIEVHQAGSGEEAVAAMGRLPVDVVVTDLRMPGLSGMALLERLKQAWPDVPVVMMTAHGTVPAAVEAMKLGAADFVQKPFDREEFLFVVRKALGSGRHAQAEGSALDGSGASSFVGASAAMKECLQLIARVAPGAATVLLRGESGTGKELAARAIHQQSARRAGPFVAIHCSALPEALLESELFGYEKGAFTGAAARKPGRVELAAGGTLFLDELGDVTPSVQVKLLRLIQEREFQRLGGTQTQKADVRFVAATHRDLEAMIARGQFREDLFFRLNVVPLWLPPLRERADDVGPLATHFCALLGPRNQRPDARLEPAALALLASQPWPGNVRQLQNFVERLVVMSERPAIRAADVERELLRELGGGRARAPQPAAAATGAASPGALPPSVTAAPPGAEEAGRLDTHRREAEREALGTALARAGNNRTLAARILGVSRRTLYNKLEEYGIT